jgi:hypothetical protein
LTSFNTQTWACISARGGIAPVDQLIVNHPVVKEKGGKKCLPTEAGPHKANVADGRIACSPDAALIGVIWRAILWAQEGK